MIKRRRIAVLGVLAAVAASIFVLPASSASAVTYTNACRNTAQTANWDQVNVTLTGTAPATVAANGSVPLTNIQQTLAVPGAIFVAGYNLGLLTTGVNNIPTDFTTVIDAANTVELSQTTNTVSQTLSTTITDPDGVPGSGDETGTDASATITFADETWTAGASGTIGFHEHNDPAVAPTTGGGIRTNSSLAGGLIHVQFRCTSGTVAGMNPGVPTFTDAPNFASTDIIPVVTDNFPPVANATVSPTAGTPGTLVTLDGSGSTDQDLPNDTLSYMWTQTSGPAVTLSDPTAVMPTFTSPDVQADTPLTFDLTVTDQAAKTDTASVTYTAQPTVVGVSVTANAGPDQTITEPPSGQTVTLDGSASSSTGPGPLTYMWTQTSGPAVTLSDPTAVMPTFTAPPAPATLTFSLTFCDTSTTPATCGTDSVTITVNQGPMTDLTGLVIVNGPVSSTKTSKSFVYKVTNIGTSPTTINESNISSTVDVNGAETGSVTVNPFTKTLNPGASTRVKLSWSYPAGSLATGDTVDFHACVNVTGDIDTTNDCDDETATAK